MLDVAEFTRECPEVIAVIQEWRGSVPKPHDFQRLKRYAGGQKTRGLWIKGELHCIPLGRVFHVSGMAGKAFSEINPRERRKRIRALLETEKSLGLSHTKQAKDAKKAWIDRDGSLPNLRDIEPHPGEFMIRHPGVEANIPASVLGKTKVYKKSTDQIVLFWIHGLGR